MHYIMNEKERLETALQCSFMRWDEVAEHGSSSPRWTDGRDLNYIRKQIAAEKKALENLSYFPEIYFRETPPPKPYRYMVNEEAIRMNAGKALEQYEKDSNYQYIWRNVSRLDEEQREMVRANAALMCVQKLKEFIQSDNLVKMKNYEDTGRHTAFFKSCRKDMELLIQELEELGDIKRNTRETAEKKCQIKQMDIFDYIGKEGADGKRCEEP